MVEKKNSLLLYARVALAVLIFIVSCGIPQQNTRILQSAQKASGQRLPSSNSSHLDQLHVTASVSESVSSTSGWWYPYLEGTARTFLPWDGPEFGWCQKTGNKDMVLPTPQPGEVTKGLQYIKSPKTSSSTCAGVNIAIARQAVKRLAPKQQQKSGHANNNNHNNNTIVSVRFSQCRHYERHIFAGLKLHLNRNQKESLLWTFVRNPMLRDISAFYFRRMSIRAQDANDTDNFLDFLKFQQSRQTKYIDAAPESIRLSHRALAKNVRSNPSGVAAYVHEHIFQAYDFIGVTERTTESLAVMTLLWDLDPTSVIVLSAKQAGNYVDMGLENCTKLQKAPKTLHPRVQQYLNSSEYKNHHADFLLYHAANLSLDRTIESLGSERVKERVLLLQQLEELADAKCRDKAIFPCSVDGQRNTATNCYFGDSGCGYRCVDRVMELYRQGRLTTLTG